MVMVVRSSPPFLPKFYWCFFFGGGRLESQGRAACGLMIGWPLTEEGTCVRVGHVGIAARHG